VTTAPPYRLDELGWLQFERVCSLLLAADAGLSDLSWIGHADSGRNALVQTTVTAIGDGTRLEGPVTVAVVWARQDYSPRRRLVSLTAHLEAMGSWCEQRVMLVTNLEGQAVREALAHEPWANGRTVVVCGAAELGEGLDRHPSVRAAMPSVLGCRDLGPLISQPARAVSSLDVERAQALARVFWPTRAYERAREVLFRHRFVVLTGPPEMGKTAIAQMLALAQMTDGWQAHEASSPEQLWRVFDASRRQVFVADDAFGSTEYRPDAAERWARSLGRLLTMLDSEHWLIWTSRPAPLKAGLSRIRREHHAERFPAPGEVLVDAASLDLSEKTLILFRHAKARGPSSAARGLLRSSALAIVEHPHFTPERIRRLVSDRLEGLSQIAARDGTQRVEEEIAHELASPTEAMRTSFRALAPEHRELLIALLDAPAGLIDERDLAATVRRHHRGGLSRPPGELIDRLTDHFLRVTPLGIGWVHPSWRDLVVDELRRDAAARRRFLDACGVHGAMLALSREGGVAGERMLPLLVDDGDWDHLGDRTHQLLHELEDQELGHLLLALQAVRTMDVTRSQKREARNLATYLLITLAQHWDQQRVPVPSFLLEQWYDLNLWALQPIAPPRLDRTWAELYPVLPRTGGLDRSELARADEWLAVAQILHAYDPGRLAELGFFERDQELLARLTETLARTTDEDTRPLAESILTRIEQLVDGRVYLAAHDALTTIEHSGDEQPWWTPEDLPAPPSSDPVPIPGADFAREDVRRVLVDL
jgi:conflict system STAND superfamily ATPase